VTSERTRTQGWAWATSRGSAHHQLSVACASSLKFVCGLRRGNLEDALQKLQSFIDRAALDVQPIESDPVKQKKLAKQYVPRASHVHWQPNAVRMGCCSITGRAVSMIRPCICVGACRKKQANENRLQTKKMKSMKKTDRKAGKRVDF
jgi:hypothetical protein